MDHRRRGARRRMVAGAALFAVCAFLAWWSGGDARRDRERITAPSARASVGGRISSHAVVGSPSWAPVPGAAAPDLMALSFSPQGDTGAAVSSEGILLVTRDGGLNWQTMGRAPLGEGEMATVVVAHAMDRIFVGSGVDESAFTAFYDLDGAGKWRASSGDYGGLAGASADGHLLVGGGGLVAQAKEDVGTGWLLSQLPPCGQVTLYGAAREGKRLLVVGDYGLLASSLDNGATWECSSLKTGEQQGAVLYAVALSAENGIAGGARGALWRLKASVDEWSQVQGLGSGMSVFAVHLDDEGATQFAGGGDDERSGTGFIISSRDGGANWQREFISGARGRIVGFARGSSGLFAATLDGHILVRRKSSIGSAP